MGVTTGGEFHVGFRLQPNSPNFRWSEKTFLTNDDYGKSLEFPLRYWRRG
jgi:hypothetical protein